MKTKVKIATQQFPSGVLDFSTGCFRSQLRKLDAANFRRSLRSWLRGSEKGSEG